VVESNLRSPSTRSLAHEDRRGGPRTREAIRTGRRLREFRHLAALIAFLIALGSELSNSLGQNPLDPITRETVLSSARANFLDPNQRKRFTREKASKLAANSSGAGHNDEWFKGFRGTTTTTNANLYVVASNIDVVPNRLVSLAGTATPGDVVRFQWRHKGQDRSHLSVYVGEESFPGGTKSYSFFIYPYRTQLEYNTLPPRKHRQQMIDDGGKPAELDGVFSYSDPDPRRGGVQWLQSTYLLGAIKVSDYPLYNRSTLVNDHATATLLRGSDEDLTALKFQQEGSFPSGIGSTSYRTSGEEIWITFFPDKCSKVTNADRIGFVQVGRKLFNGSPMIQGKPIRSSELLIVEAKAQLDSPEVKADEKARKHWEYQLRRGKLASKMETNDGFFVDTVLANRVAKLLEPPSVFIESVEMVEVEMRSPSYNRLGPDWYWVRKDLPESSDPPRARYTSAQMRDAPSLYYDFAVNGCKRLSNVSSGELVVEFEVWSWCEAGSQAGQFLEGLRWEYHLPPDRLPYSVVTKTGLGQPSNAFRAALDKYLHFTEYTVQGDNGE